MGYYLKAIIGKREIILKGLEQRLKAVPLFQGYHLFPITNHVMEELGISELNMLEPNHKLSEVIFNLCRSLSKNGPVAYVEAEYFGGDGDQGSASFINGQLVLGPTVGNGSINQALSLLGVKKEDSKDEFEAISLPKYRDTEKWLRKI